MKCRGRQAGRQGELSGHLPCLHAVKMTTTATYLFQSIHSSIEVLCLQHAKYDTESQIVNLRDIIRRKPQTDKLHRWQHVANTCRFLHWYHPHNVLQTGLDLTSRFNPRWKNPKTKKSNSHIAFPNTFNFQSLLAKFHTSSPNQQWCKHFYSKIYQELQANIRHWQSHGGQHW